MLWDGMEFFGFDLKKVKRLKGKDQKYQPKWTDKFTSLESSTIMFATFVVFMYIVIDEGLSWV